jgi:hypothetical protein
MPGEMTTGSWFDVTELKAIEIETATGDEMESNIIDFGENFFLRATFRGGGPSWLNMTQNGFEYRARFWADGMGPIPAPDPITDPDWRDLDLGTVTGELVPGQIEYEIDSPTTTIDVMDVVYRCGVTVSFRTSDGGPWFGVLGYNEDCVIQISWMEEIE